MRFISAPLSKHHIMESLCKTMYMNNLFLSLQGLRLKIILFFLFFSSYNIWWLDCLRIWGSVPSFQLANTHHRIFIFTLSKCLSNVLWLCQGVQMCSSKPLLYIFILVEAFMLFFQWKLNYQPITSRKYTFWNHCRFFGLRFQQVVIIACRPPLNEWSSGGEQFRSWVCHMGASSHVT